MTTFPLFNLFRGVFYAACALFFTAVLASCSYKSDIRQGDEELPQKLRLLKIGMKKHEVEEALGTRRSPEVFEGNTWVYYYRHRKGGFFPTTRAAGAILSFEGEFLTDVEFIGDAQFYVWEIP